MNSTSATPAAPGPADTDAAFWSELLDRIGDPRPMASPQEIDQARAWGQRHGFDALALAKARGRLLQASIAAEQAADAIREAARSYPERSNDLLLSLAKAADEAADLHGAMAAGLLRDATLRVQESTEQSRGERIDHAKHGLSTES